MKSLPVVRGAHAYAGAVIEAGINERVRAFVAIFGETDERADSIGTDRPRTVDYSAGPGRQNDPQGCNQCGGTPEYVQAPPRGRRPLTDLIDGVENAMHEQTRMDTTGLSVAEEQGAATP
jgi:hypothetical protein